MTKRLVCILLVCAMLVACLPVQAFAQTVSPSDAELVSSADCAVVSSADDVTIVDTAQLEGALADLGKTSDVFADNYGLLGDVGDNEFYETENNDSMSKADSIGNDYTVYGDLHKRVMPDDTADYFKIKISKKSEIQIVCGATDQNTTISILNSSGKSVASGKNEGALDTGVYGDTITATLSAGTYYIVVKDSVADNYLWVNYVFYVNWVDYSAPLASGTWSGLKWQISRENVLTISGSGAMPDAVYNSSTELTDAPWANYWEYVKSIVIENGVTSIGDCAFTDCYYAEKVTIADSVTSIGEAAFWCCEKIKTIDLPDNLKTIEVSAFESCTGLREITIPAKTTFVGLYAFTGCSSLTKINVASGNTAYCSIDGALYNKAATRIIACPGGKTSLRLPASVTTIGEGAFFDCAKLGTLVLNDALIYIEDYAFTWCVRMSGALNLPDSVKSIGDYAFYECDALTTVDIPAGVETIGVYAFAGGDKMAAINVDEANENFSSVDGVLYNNDVSVLLAVPGGKSNIDIPESVLTIGTGAFVGCKGITGVVIPKNVNCIEEKCIFIGDNRSYFL